MLSINRLIIMVAFVTFTQVAAAQKATYELIKEESGLAFFSKWVTLKGANAGQQALFIKVTNKSGIHKSYTLGVEVFLDNIMVEEAAEATFCIKPNKTNQGKLNGIYFVSDKVTQADLASGKTVVELSGLVVNTADACPKAKKK